MANKAPRLLAETEQVVDGKKRGGNKRRGKSMGCRISYIMYISNSICQTHFTIYNNLTCVQFLRACAEVFI